MDIDQRAAGVARIDGGIGLNEELIVGDADLGAGERGDDAVGHGLADPERIANGEHDVADLQLIGIAELQRGELFAHALEPHYREIGAGVLEHQLGLELALVGERDLHFARPLDHVVVGDHEPARIDDDAGAERALHLLARQARVRAAEEAAEERIVEERRAILDHLGRIDVDHRRGDPLHDRRIGEGQLGGRAGHPALLGSGDAAEPEQEKREKRGCEQARKQGHGPPANATELAQI